MELTKFEDIQNGYKNFMKEWATGQEHRYRSYDYCKNLFEQYYTQKTLNGINLTEEEKDYFALNLFCYLASWGMLRGSAWLLKLKSYRFFVGTVDIIFNKKYESLLTLNPYSEDFESKKDNYFESICDLAGELETDLKKRGGKTSIVLLGKIIMGTYGCIPAYDMYDKKALKALGFKAPSKIKTALPNTFKIILENREFMEDAMKDIKNNKEYEDNDTHDTANCTVFKLLDMILWEYGKRINEKK